MKKKTLKKGKGTRARIIVSIILILLVSYLICSLTYGIFTQIALTDAMLSPFETFEFLSEATLEVLLIPILLSVIFAYWIINSIDIWDKSKDDESNFGVKGTAKWGNAEEKTDGKTFSTKSEFSKKHFKKAMTMEEGIIVGRVPNKNKTLIIHDKTDLETMNVFVNGPSGSGKDQSYIYPNLVNIRSHSIVVIDPKGESYNATAQLKRDQGYKVYNVDFAEFSESRYNALDYVKNDEDAETVAFTIASNNKEKDGFFKERATSLLSALITYVKSTYPKKEANMEKVIYIFNKYVSDAEICEGWMNDMPEDHPAKGLLESVLSSLSSENTRSGVTSSFQSLVSAFQLNRIKQMTEVSDFTFDEFQEHKSILYVKLKVPTNPYQTLTSIFFNQMIDRLFELGSKNTAKYGAPHLDIPIHLILNEFPNIGKVNGYEKTLSLARGYKIYIHTIVQDISQLQDKHLYGLEATKTIISNHSAKLILKVGEKDGAKYWSDWLDDTTYSYKNPSIQQSKQGVSKSVSTVYERRRLMPANDFLKMDGETAYLILSGQDPLKVSKSWQFKVYPGLLFNKDRIFCYNDSRKQLGFVDEPSNLEIKNNVSFSFEDYQKKQQKVTYDENYEEQIEDTEELSFDEDDNNQEGDELTPEELSMLYDHDGKDEATKDTSISNEDMLEDIEDIEKELSDLDEMDIFIEDDDLNSALEEFIAEDENEENSEPIDAEARKEEELPM